MKQIAKSALELFLILLPAIVVAGLGYVIFISPDTEITEGSKLTVSAFLGAMASLVLIQYSSFLEKVVSRKDKHQNALAVIEFKLNEQLNWISDVAYTLRNHENMLKKVVGGETHFIHDASSYREPISIDEDVHDLASRTLKNQLLKLVTDYKKLESSVASFQQSYDFILNLALSNEKHIDSYRFGLPQRILTTQTLIRFAESLLDDTKFNIASCRVLSRSADSFLAKLRRFLFIQLDPKDYHRLVRRDLQLLEQEIAESKASSRKQIDRILNMGEE